MHHQQVTVARPVARSASDLWQQIGDFGLGWHPLVRRSWGEPGQVRAFQVTGDETTYRERLTYRSDSDQRLRYTHSAGIDGIESYDATLSVTEHGRGSLVEMSAQIGAGDPTRLADVAADTQAIFEQGLDALEPGGQARVIDGTPKLTATYRPASGTTLCLFLHGIGGARSNWDGQLPIAAEFMPAAALDLRGYGESVLGPKQTTLDDYFADIGRVMEQTGCSKLVLVGLSYGAWIAASYAAACPDQMVGLVLAGGCTGMSEASEEVRAGFRQMREAPLDQGLEPADFADDVLGVICGPDASEPVKDTLRASMSAIQSATYRDAVRCFTNPPGPLNFTNLTCPVLMMTGEHDKLAPPDEIRSVAERIHATQHNVQFEMLGGAGHVCNLEAAPQFNTHLRAFLRRHYAESL